MCGLIGVLGDVSPERVQAALDTLAHRGPDGQGVARFHGLTLAHRRLAVLDLVRGAQPLMTSDGALAIVFNGEIYNHRELRSALAESGYAFRTTSDTETLLALYARHGPDCVSMLRGMFAFLVYDSQKRTLFGARDPFGKKPLFWMANPAPGMHFAIASEPRALLALDPERKCLVSHAGITGFLAHDYATGNDTVYEGIHRVGAATMFELPVDDTIRSELKEVRYWHPRVGRGATAAPASALHAVSELQSRLQLAVERRMLADVPLGILLSGGIDSSIIAALVTRLQGRDVVRSFSIGFEDHRFDEGRHAAEVARHVGTLHENRVFGARECIESIRDVMRFMDEPLADPSILPTVLLCAVAREHVTVALGGDGGDELFAGYDTFEAIRPAQQLRRWFPAAADRLADLFVGLAGTNSRRSHMPLEFKVRRFLRGFRFSGAEMVRRWHAPFDNEGVQRLMPDIPIEQINRDAADAGAEHAGTSEQDAVLAWYQQVYLVDDILVKTDRASMKSSLEVRSPFLDLDLVDFVNGLPFDLKMRGGERKHLLREAIREWQQQGLTLPSSVLERPKKGFGIPIADWLRGPLVDDVHHTLGDAWPDVLSFIVRPERDRLVAQHMNGRRNCAKELWALLVLAWWANYWLEPRPTD